MPSLLLAVMLQMLKDVSRLDAQNEKTDKHAHTDTHTQANV